MAYYPKIAKFVFFDLGIIAPLPPNIATQYGIGESRFYVRIVSDKFKDMTLLARQCAVKDVLAYEIDGKVHALSLDASAPGWRVFYVRLVKSS